MKTNASEACNNYIIACEATASSYYNIYLKIIKDGPLNNIKAFSKSKQFLRSSTLLGLFV